MMRSRRVGGVAMWIVVAAIVFGAGSGEARITIRPHAELDDFFFHAHYSREAFDPAEDFTLEIWNCASGVMPSFLSGPEPLVICRDDAGTTFTLADLVYSVHVPGGSCVDRGRSCYFRSRDVDPQTGGVSYFRVQYASRDRGNRVWLNSTGDLSAANQANMLLLIAIDGQPRAVLEDTFVPLGHDGWFSKF